MFRKRPIFFPIPTGKLLQNYLDLSISTCSKGSARLFHGKTGVGAKQLKFNCINKPDHCTSSIHSYNIENFNIIAGNNELNNLNEIKNEKHFNLQTPYKGSFEISRIPSLNKNKYCISTVATQADLDKGTIMAERKDTQYRNQEFSDVESQIVSIEFDVCSDVYGSGADLNYLKNNIISRNSAKIIGNPIGPYDRFISPRRELASAKVNDYIAFKNCINLGFEPEADAIKELNIKDQNGNFTLVDPVLLTASKLNIPTKRMIFRISSLASTKSLKNEDNVPVETKPSNELVLYSAGKSLEINSDDSRTTGESLKNYNDSRNEEPAKVLSNEKSLKNTKDFNSILTEKIFSSNYPADVERKDVKTGEKSQINIESEENKHDEPQIKSSSSSSSISLTNPTSQTNSNATSDDSLTEKFTEISEGEYESERNYKLKSNKLAPNKALTASSRHASCDSICETKTRKKRLRTGSVKACLETDFRKSLISSSTTEIETIKVRGISMPTYSINASMETISNCEFNDILFSKDLNNSKSVRFSDSINYM